MASQSLSPYPELPHSHNGLKAFESVARLMSFTRAADELHVTQSAVSRQVKQLEDELGSALVIRGHRSIELTVRGQALFETLANSYRAVQTLIASWQTHTTRKIVIKAALSYATRALIPKIQVLNERYPDHEIVVIPSMDEELSLYGDDYDLLIMNTRVGARYANQPEIVFLREEYMAPVCAQSLSPAINDMESIMGMPRLHPTLDHSDWRAWQANSGYATAAQPRNTTFYTLDFALSACLAGQGVTVTDLLLVLPELQRGYLLCPDKIQIQHSAWQYFCHCRTRSPIIDELVSWLQAETAREVSELNQLAQQQGWRGVVA